MPHANPQPAADRRVAGPLRASAGALRGGEIDGSWDGGPANAVLSDLELALVTTPREKVFAMADPRPSQAQIGYWLGISQPVVSKYARAGMPLDTLEAAAAWYDRNVTPRARNILDGREPVRPPRDGRRRPAADIPPPEGIDPDAGPAEVFGDMATMNGPDAVRLVLTLSHLALPLLKAGRFGEIEHALRVALRAVPERRREELVIDLDNKAPDAIPGSVWEELLRPLLDALEPRDQATVERDRQECATASPEQEERVQRLMYAVAAGQWVANAPAAAAPAMKRRRR